jgi:hypothetical protein
MGPMGLMGLMGRPAHLPPYLSYGFNTPTFKCVGNFAER